MKNDASDVECLGCASALRQASLPVQLAVGGVLLALALIALFSPGGPQSEGSSLEQHDAGAGPGLDEPARR